MPGTRQRLRRVIRSENPRRRTASGKVTRAPHDPESQATKRTPRSQHRNDGERARTTGNTPGGDSRSVDTVDRKPLDYQRLVHRIRRVVGKLIPAEARVAVVSNGDPELLRLGRHRTFHFPRQADGDYAGYHPTCSLAAIAHLESLRALGVQYLVLPATARWWLDYYAGFKRHLEMYHSALRGAGDSCSIFRLDVPALAGEGNWTTRMLWLAKRFREDHQRDPVVLDCHTALPLAACLPGVQVFQPPQRGAALPYLDGSIDWVLMRASRERNQRCEAARVAAAALITVAASGNRANPSLTIEARPPLRRRPRLLSATVVIPCTGGTQNLQGCLRALLTAICDAGEVEIIVVDDATVDGTASMPSAWCESTPHIRVLRNSTETGFSQSCNRAARMARGEMLVFVSPDLLLLPESWIPMSRVFERIPEAGAVGGRILSPDGNLLSAGGLLHRDGTAVDFGEGDFRIEDPIYRFVRTVDFCATSLFATRRRCWEAMRGFDLKRIPDERFAGVDYFLRLGKAGFGVYYQPELVGVKLGPEPGGNGERNGTHQTAPPHFLERWKRDLGSLPPPPAVLDQQYWDTVGTMPARSWGGPSA